MANAFVDTNILVYLFDHDEPLKRERATHVFQRVVDRGDVVLSTQVLQEFYVVVTGKLRPPLSREQARTALEALAQLPVVAVTPDIVLAAARMHDSESLSFWDALVVASAQAAGARVLLSEDLQHDRRFGDLRVENPFLDPPSVEAHDL